MRHKRIQSQIMRNSVKIKIIKKKPYTNLGVQTFNK